MAARPAGAGLIEAAGASATRGRLKSRHGAYSHQSYRASALGMRTGSQRFPTGRGGRAPTATSRRGVPTPLAPGSLRRAAAERDRRGLLPTFGRAPFDAHAVPRMMAEHLFGERGR